MLTRRGAAITLLCFAAVSAALIDKLTPAVELTRFRNSLLASVGEPADFTWKPEAAPGAFEFETSSPPPLFLDVLAKLGGAGQESVPLMSRLVTHLRSKPKRQGPIQSTTIDAYREIVQSGRGYCADYTQVFNGLAYSAGLAVREWGLSFDRYSGDGHAFNEIYDAANKRWVFVDPMHAFYVRDRRSGIPLSVLEFRGRLTEDGGVVSMEVVPIGDAFLFDSAQEAFEYYARGADQFYLWFGSDVLTYDNHPLVRFIGPWSRPLEQLAAIAAGIHPTIRLLPTSTNRAEIESLLRLPQQIFGLMLAAALLGILGCAQIVRVYRQSVRAGSRPGRV